MVPVLFKLGAFNIYSYGFFVALGIVTGAILCVLKVRKSNIKISFEQTAALFFYAVLSALVGSRLLFVLVNFDVYRQNPLGVLKIWEGGLIFYGGLILAIGVSIWTMKWHRLPIWKLADLVSPPIALGLFFGRIGCFLAGCCYGGETSISWGVIFTDSNSLAQLNVPVHPTQLYDAANGLALFLFLSWIERKKSFNGEIFWLFLLLYSISRFFVEMFRGDPRGFVLGEIFSTSQGIGILLAITSLFMLFYLKKSQWI
jgi:phosphatidylglycerol:prolipoprotein diacylglycerol transferase